VLYIKSVRAQQFGPFEDVELDFDEGLTVIQGKVTHALLADGNGAGKSMIFEAIVWALYGSLMRGPAKDIKADDIIRNEAGKGTSVTVVLLRDGVEVVVNRVRKCQGRTTGLSLHVGGEDMTPGRTDMAQAQLENHLGMSKNTFLSTYMFGVRSAASNFLTATDAERKNLLESLLDYDRFTTAYSQAKSDALALSKELSEHENTVWQAQKDIEHYKHELDEHAQDAPDEEYHREQEQERDRLTEEGTSLAEDVKQVKAETLELEEADSRKAEKAEKVYTQALDKWSAQASDVRTAERECDRLSRTVQTAERAVEDAKHAKHCPTCGQEVSGVSTDLVEQAERKLTEAEDDTQQATETHKKLHAGLQDKPVRPPHEESAEFTELFDVLGVAERELQVLRSDVKTLNVELKALQQATALYAKTCTRLKQGITDAEARIVTANADSADTLALKEQVDYLVQVFHPTGLRSHLLDAHLATINRHCAYYAQRLVGAGTQLSLSATSKTASGETREKIDIHLQIPHSATSFAMSSTGQRTRVMLALLLSIRQTVIGDASMQLFADELFDGVDATGVDAVSALLCELSEETPVIVISHRSEIKSSADQIITVCHDGTSATIHTE